MAGYCGFSMSNNAVDAYRNGEKPFSRWRKADIIEALDEACGRGDIPFSALVLADSMPAADLKKAVLRRSSWHHTGKYYSRTTFYEIDVDALLAYAKDEEARRHPVSALCDVFTGRWDHGNAITEKKVLRGYIDHNKMFIAGGDFFCPHQYTVIESED